MADPLLLSLDQGTTSTRAVLYDLHGREQVSASRPLRQSYPADGWVEHDAEEIFSSSVSAMREVLERASAPVAALGITNQRETTVVWERATGRPIAPAIVWQDRRTADGCAALRDGGVEPEVSRATGLRLDPYFSGTKAAWLLDHVDGARAAAQAGALAFGTIDSWLVWKLTGGRVHATDATNASRTLLFDLERLAWSDELCDLLRVPRSMLPDVRDTAGDFGETLPEVLGRAIPIRGVAGDQQAAMMGQGCVRAGEMKSTYGTGAFMLVHTGEHAARSQAGLLSTVAAQIGGRASYALEGSIFIAGAAIQWLNEALGVAGGAKAVEQLAQQARPHHGVVFVPAFTGLGAPWWDPDARGAVFGLTRDAGLAEIASAAFDAGAFQTVDLIHAMRSDAPQAFEGAHELRIDGGMASSRTFAQRLADITGLNVGRASYSETTALGAALFAGVGSGLYADVEAAARARPEAETFTPALAAPAREAALARWRGAVQCVVARTAVG
ncbi:MAG TPA: glycerol kinase GlpK [Caulobacteraceae bacterium]